MDKKFLQKELSGILLLLFASCTSISSSQSFDPVDEFSGGGYSQSTLDPSTNNIAMVQPTVTPLGGGGQIAYSTYTLYGSPKINIVNVEGDNVRETGDFTGYLATWSPNGDQIIFMALGNSGAIDLFMVDANGDNRHQVTNTRIGEGIPSWAPDGLTIATTRKSEGFEQIFLLSLENGEVLQQLTYENDINHFVPTWSPDGSQIVFVKGGGAQESYEIYIMDTTGENMRQLTDNNVSDYFPTWSPDGTQIAYISMQRRTAQIFIMDIDGLNVQQVTDVSDGAAKPVWSPDGKLIAFHSLHAGVPSIYIVNIETGEVWLLVEDAGLPSWSSK